MGRRDPTEELREGLEPDPSLSSRAKDLEKENEEMAGLPAPRAGEEVEVKTRRREVVEEGSDGRRAAAWDEDATKAELMEVAQGLDIPGRSTMTKDELLRAIDRAERGQPQ